MDIQLIAVPYDTALRDFRMGAGPERLLRTGLAAELRSDGHRVHVEWVEVASDAAPAEIRTAFEINRILAERVRRAVARGRLPVVLAGNCNTALAILAGLPPGHDRGVVWCDAHGDFNTPDARVRTGFGTEARGLRERTDGVYVHLDLDVLDPGDGCANSFAAAGGLRLDEIRAVLGEAAELFQVQAVALTAYDPDCDPDGKVNGAAATLLRAILAPGRHA